MIALVQRIAGATIVSGINITALSQDDIDGHKKLLQYFQQHSKITNVIMKMGAHGVIVGADDKIVHYPAFPLAQPLVSVSGAGDSLAAGTIWALLAQPSTTPSVHSAIKFGLAAAKMSLESAATVNPLLRVRTLQQILVENKLEL